MRSRGRARSEFVLLAWGLCLVACASAPVPAPLSAASETPCATTPKDGYEKESDEQLVRKLLAATGAKDLGKQVMDATLEAFRKMPNLPEGFIERFKQNVDPNRLVENIVPIYLKHYDHATLLAALRFYESDPGRALIGQLPAVTAESMAAGQTWGKAIATKTLSDMGLTPASKP